MDRNNLIQENKYKILLPVRESRIKNDQPRKKSLVQRILQKVRRYRVVGYITIGIGLHKGGTELEKLIIEMFLLILFTEMASKSKKPSNHYDALKEEYRKSTNLD